MEDSKIIELFDNLGKEIAELTKQVSVNCTKLDNFEVKLDSMKENTDLLPEMFEMLKANGNNLEVVSSRIDKLE